MNLVDSSGYLEYFTGGPNANIFAPIIADLNHLIVPTICIYEVFKRTLQQLGQNTALSAAALLQQGKVIDLDFEIALNSAKLSSELKLPMADSIILATARKYNAIIWTQDIDFAGLENVKLIPWRQ